VAAGTGTDPYLMVLTGLGALGGPLHGRSSLDAEDLLAAVRVGGVEVLDRTETYAGGRLPGFGHAVYVDADPRAEALLDRVARLDPEGWPAVEALLLAVSRRDGLSPNVDLALAALVQAAGLVPGAGETVFGLSRIVGWLAHGLEEAPQGLRFRGRAVYRGGVSGEIGYEVSRGPRLPGPAAAVGDRHTEHSGG
ncbi:MAG: citrate/2-methylcitrate synthase, partial [Lapillicoccus sp.]